MTIPSINPEGPRFLASPTVTVRVALLLLLCCTSFVFSEGRALLQTYASTLSEGSSLGHDGILQSQNGRYMLRMQGDKNIVVYESANAVATDTTKPIWASRTCCDTGSGPYRLDMQLDGNLVGYDRYNRAFWHSDTYGAGRGPFRAVIQDDGNFVVYDDGMGRPVWASQQGRLVFEHNIPRGPITTGTPQELNIEATATQPFINPCLTTPPCPGGLDSWFYCTVGDKNVGCKTPRPFKGIDCSAQCSLGAPGMTVRSYNISSLYGVANERNRYNPFIVVPEGRLKKICIDGCDGSRSFNELSSLRMNVAAYLNLYTPIPGTERTGSSYYYNIKGSPLAVSQNFTVPIDEFPSVCFENPSFGTDAYSRQQRVCMRDRRSYPTNSCAKQCYENNMGLAPLDRIVFGIKLNAIPGDSFSMSNLIVSLHSEVSQSI